MTAPVPLPCGRCVIGSIRSIVPSVVLGTVARCATRALRVDTGAGSGRARSSVVAGGTGCGAVAG
jgi:hypothetical protein